MGVTITDKSGLAGVALWVNLILGLEGKQNIDETIKQVKIYLPDYFKEENLRKIEE